MPHTTSPRSLITLLLLLFLVNDSLLAAKTRSRVTRRSSASSSTAKKTAKAPAPKAKAKAQAQAKTKATSGKATANRRRGRAYLRSTAYSRGTSLIKDGPWLEPTFADSSQGDWTAGEDPVVRKAAEEALGPYNGSVVVADPYTGRILALVNQKLALKSGFQPCSTIKVVAGLAALSEGIIDRETMVPVARRAQQNLTWALAVSNNAYFAHLGEKLGFDRISYYARLFGLGERAGLNIEGEQPGLLPTTPPPGGLGLMTSFGHGISLTPLELTALLSMVANGGTLYYLQHPRTTGDIEHFVPRVKRKLEVTQHIEQMKPGMMGAVEYGTARRAGYQSNDLIFGKTGTCTDERTPTHLGWFGSFNDVGRNKLVVVVLLTGGRPVNGPVASGVAGAVYKNLGEVDYFSQPRTISSSAMISLRP